MFCVYGNDLHSPFPSPFSAASPASPRSTRLRMEKTDLATRILQALSCAAGSRGRVLRSISTHSPSMGWSAAAASRDGPGCINGHLEAERTD
ncbi:hypothetical protein Zmor_012903 [Zophobas morio]|uniref:Uncharacterized protein n=1 Tax=Zophobas morio TaxID=2755281 RepID=A0AA38MF26_9CUCU|nr:hypothetical protein Zmor_012903 [Zophobas morio]